MVRKLLTDDLVHVIASDAHSATWRPPDLSPALSLGDLGTRLTRDVPAAILAGADLTAA
jgi:tyrosine-protein phosphatase YwqE